MRIFIAGLSAALLAGCGNPALIGNMGNGPATGGPGMPGNLTMPSLGGGGGGGNAMGPSRTSREGMIAECSQDLGRNAPQGTDIAALCTCSVDKMFERVPQRDAVRQCATEQNVALPGLQ